MDAYRTPQLVNQPSGDLTVEIYRAKVELPGLEIIGAAVPDHDAVGAILRVIGTRVSATPNDPV